MRASIALMRELFGYAPIIVLYASVALMPSYYGADRIVWLVVMQFLLMEMAACGVAVALGRGLARGTDTVSVWHGASRAGQMPRPVSPRQRDLAIIGLGVFTVLLLPWLVHDVFGDTTRSMAVAAVFLPRVLDAWHIRRRGAELGPALARSGYLGWALCLGYVVIAMLLSGSGAPLPLNADRAVPAWTSFAAGLIVVYYFAQAINGAISLQSSDSR